MILPVRFTRLRLTPRAWYHTRGVSRSQAHVVEAPLKAAIPPPHSPVDGCCVRFRSGSGSHY